MKLTHYLTALLAAGLCALVAAPAALATEPLPTTGLSPADGTAYAPQAQAGIPWQITGGPPRAGR
jgi:hypothetical protein